MGWVRIRTLQDARRSHLRSRRLLVRRLLRGRASHPTEPSIRCASIRTGETAMLRKFRIAALATIPALAAASAVGSASAQPRGPAFDTNDILINRPANEHEDARFVAQPFPPGVAPAWRFAWDRLD